MKNPFSPSCRWIWLHREEGVNEYACFRKDFELAQVPKKARLLIAVDSDYQLFVNGAELWGRAYSDYPEERSYSVHDVAQHLKTGRNIIAALAYFRGQRFHTYRPGKPGLIVQVEAGETVVVSDSSWLCRRSPAYRSGPVPKMTNQLAFIYFHDGRGEDGWESSPEPPGDWRPAVELAGPTDGFRTSIPPRPLPFLHRGEPIPCVLEGAGSLIVTGESSPLAAHPFVREGRAPETTPAAEMTSRHRRLERRHACRGETGWPVEFPSAAAGRGGYAIFDAGREEAGLLALDLDAPAGTVVDIGHGEHLGDHGVRVSIDERAFADRHVCGGGRHVWTYPFRRLGCRYIELHVTGNDGPAVIHAVSLVPTTYRVTETGSFSSADALLGHCRRVAVRTLELCMHEHYEDCPWREQALYAYDSRNQAIYGYYAFGEARFPEVSFRLIGKGAREDGLLEMCSPSKIPYTIPTFSLSWICAVRDHWLFTGDPVLSRDFEERILSILGVFAAQHDARSGLLALPPSDVHWIFYEWAEGLSEKNGQKLGDTTFRIDALHNIMVAEAMEAYADILRFSGRAIEADAWTVRSRRLKRAVHRFFWDDARGCYLSFADRRKRWHTCEFTQALALAFGVAPAGRARKLRSLLLAGREDLVPLTLSSMLYFGMAMLGAPADEQEAFVDRMRDTFGGMLFRGATSLWEVGGRDDWSYGVSLCHAWSSLPVWLCHAYLLGVRPTGPGFSSFLVEPHCGGLPAAAGTVPTPRGDIRVAWECARDSFSLEVTAPPGCRPEILPRVPNRVKRRVFVNGRRVSSA